MRLKIRRLLTVAIVVVVASFGIVASPQPAEAIVGSDFDPGYIISDQKFFDSGTMSERQVQDFLNSKNTWCAPGYTCLKDYRMSTFSRPAVEAGHCAAYAGAPDEPASRIIYKAAVACKINPQVLLVLLQKETSLVTATAPTSGTYRKAMGYGCPDTSVCDSAFYGFYNQVYNAAKQFRQYTNYPNRAYKIGNVRIGWHPNAACGGSYVNIRNQATANLYNYTPYQPNRAALNNLYGTGDACSSYGNRNFWRIFHDWFGSPTGNTSVNPIGNLEVVSAGPGNFRVAGWTLDPDTANSLQVHVYVGTAGTALTADLNRADVGAAYPGKGSAHGFDAKVPVNSVGDNRVCAYAINQGPGGNTLLGCKTVTALSGAPVGQLGGVTGEAGGIKVDGWAIDPDTASPIAVHLYVGSAGKAVTANVSRSGLPAAYAAYGNNHGFADKLTAAPGNHTVCAYGINTGLGSNVQLGCKTVTVPNGSTAPTEQGRAPIGALESVTAVTDGIAVKGWAIDPDTAASINVHVYVNSSGTAHAANGERLDIAAKYPGYGAAHGFTAKRPAKPGTYKVCAYAINTAAGGHTMIGCKSIVVEAAPIPDQGRRPIGNAELIKASADGISVGGWAIDPDTRASIPVHVYVGAAGTAYVANKDRPDIGAAYPTYGSAHGFSEKVAAKPGNHRVCIYAINTGAGGHTLLKCQDVTVPQPTVVLPDRGRAPVGNLEVVTVSAGTLTVAGWTYDPDTTASIPVHVYVDSTGYAFTANKSRPDVGAAYPVYGPAHGFGEKITIGPGAHKVCVYGINTGAGGHTLLGCKSVTA